MSVNKGSVETLRGITPYSESTEENVPVKISEPLSGHHAIMQRGYLGNFELIQNEEGTYISNKRYRGDLILIEDSYSNILTVMPELKKCKKANIFTRMQNLRNKRSRNN